MKEHLNEENKLSQLINKERRSALALKLKDLEVLFEDVKRYSDKKFITQIKGINRYYKEVSLLCNNLNRISATLLKNKAASKLATVYRESSAACTAHFNEVMKNLQFHDIIEQKLGHSREVNNRIIVELLTNKSNKVPAALPYTSMGYEIITLFIAQLELIQKEYSDSFHTISLQLSHIRQEVMAVNEVIWSESEAAFFHEKQILDLPEHITKCKTLEIELGHKIAEIGSETVFIAKTTALKKRLNEALPAFNLCKQLSNQEEKRTVIENLNQTFTMESERQLWGEILVEAGLQNAVKSNEDMDSNGIELF